MAKYSDAVVSGLVGLMPRPLAGWLAGLVAGLHLQQQRSAVLCNGMFDKHRSQQQEPQRLAGRIVPHQTPLLPPPSTAASAPGPRCRPSRRP
jgi:hypothetical protein